MQVINISIIDLRCFSIEQINYGDMNSNGKQMIIPNDRNTTIERTRGFHF